MICYNILQAGMGEFKRGKFSCARDLIGVTLYVALTLGQYIHQDYL
jgi:hypothetical protein